MSQTNPTTANNRHWMFHRRQKKSGIQWRLNEHDMCDRKRGKKRKKKPIPNDRETIRIICNGRHWRWNEAQLIRDESNKRKWSDRPSMNRIRFIFNLFLCDGLTFFVRCALVFNGMYVCVCLYVPEVLFVWLSFLWSRVRDLVVTIELNTKDSLAFAICSLTICRFHCFRVNQTAEMDGTQSQRSAF